MKPSNVHQIVPAASAVLKNPFRAGSMKAQCWERFLQGGERDAILADFRALGAAGTTARTWFVTFRVFARSMVQAQRQGAAEKKDGGRE